MATDIKTINKIDNEKLVKCPLAEECRGGIIRIPLGMGEDLGDRRVMQENHNARHALWHLQMVAFGLMYGKKDWKYADKLQRVLGHLTCLREFIAEDAADFAQLLAQLCLALEQRQPDDPNKWLCFLHDHWDLIRCIAKRYDCADSSFPESSRQKINELWDRSEGDNS